MGWEVGKDGEEGLKGEVCFLLKLLNWKKTTWRRKG